MIRILLAALALVCAASMAHAGPRDIAHGLHPRCNIDWPCDVTGNITIKLTRRATGESTVIGGRPSGCPHAFCGCGASLRLFGRIIPSLNLAANWFRFPRAAPAPNMVAVRKHHVFVLVRHIDGDTWMTHDSNSGGGKTRLHARSIAGYTIVDPGGAG